MKYVVALALVVGLAGPAVAETQLRLSETARVTVHPDEIVAALRAEASARNATDAQSAVNAAMAKAVEAAHAVAGVTVSTGGYAVWPEPARPGVQPEWRANQGLDLRGGDGPAMLGLVGTLQGQGLALARLEWRLAAETGRHARAEATKAALAGLRARAEEAAGILGLRFDSFREVRLDASRPGPMPRMLGAPMAATAAMPTPTAEAEDVTVEASVEADAVLK